MWVNIKLSSYCVKGEKVENPGVMQEWSGLKINRPISQGYKDRLKGVWKWEKRKFIRRK